MKLTDQQLRNFWKKVNKIPGGCWEWTAGRWRHGYGRFRVSTRQYGAHRISFLIHYGHLPDSLIMHTCDNPLCVNPDHLRPGTHTDNMRDMFQKGRRKSGYSVRRLSADTINKIAEELAEDGVVIRELAQKYNVYPSTIRFRRRKLKNQ